MSDKTTKMLQDLTAKTKGLALEWKPTGVSDQFALSLSKGNIVIDLWRMAPPLYGFKLISKDGLELETLRFAIGEPNYELAKELYNSVAGTYRDRIVDDFLAEINRQ
jgi:hypothetical protein